MAAKFFKTSFGHSIPIVEGYRDGLPPSRDNTSPVSASSIQQSGMGKGPKESDFGIISDIFQFSMFADWLQTTPVGGRRFERLLDIGGSTGLIGQLFKAAGIARQVDNLEILDYSDALDFDRVRYFLDRIQTGRQELDGLSALDLKAGKAKIGIKNRQLWLLKTIQALQSTFPYPVNEHSHMFKLSPQGPLGLDKFILADFFDLNEKWDFLLCSTTMQHFSVPTFLKKAHELVAPGGVLMIWNAYWYWALVISRLYGDFPWGAQRLTWEDYERYLSEFRPDVNVEQARKAVSVFHKAEKRYTLNDYVEAGKQAGFKCIGQHRVVPSAGIQNRIGEWTLKGDHGAAVRQDVLRDIHCFRPDVEGVDLITQSVFVLLQKE